MKVFESFLTLVLIWKLRCCHGMPNEGAYKYLHQYGYLNSMSDVNKGTAAKTALEKFQSYAKIKVTGKMDTATIAMLTGPRCGAKDYDDDKSRRKRYIKQGTRWQKNDLTYSLDTTRRPNRILISQVEGTLDKAFKMWQAVTVLTFKKLKQNDPKADIIIKFSIGSHGDPYPFDGNGGTLAHGFFPGSNIGLSGDVHYDNEEKWSVSGQTDTTDFLWTSIHELGHALGLHHSREPSAIMWPWYVGYKAGLKLTKDDITGIQSIYGAPPLKKKSPKKISSSICRYSSFNAITYNQKTGDTYFFKSKAMWRMKKDRMADSNHQAIAAKWKGLPEYTIDAAYTRKDGYTILFRGDRYWAYDQNFNRKTPASGLKLSRYIKNFKDVKQLDRIDAALTYTKRGKTYFFRKNRYWRYDERLKTIDRGYPKLIQRWWKGVQTPVDGAMRWKDGKTFFLRGNKIYRYIPKSQNKEKLITKFIKNCRN